MRVSRAKKAAKAAKEPSPPPVQPWNATNRQLLLDARVSSTVSLHTAHKNFLLIEDNDSDAMLLRRCFIRAHLTNPVYTVHSGEAAIEYLTRTGRYEKHTEASQPSVIFLDLRLPGIDGFQVLKWIRSRLREKAVWAILTCCPIVIMDL